uniref:NADH dehydrogenase [ubiquinone] 1 beta subcomplex subunit 11, mitochondrial n=1 Tax=Arcella intermedia TaxID=1963864 RepID=A0A6B2LVW3_9EUKA
MFGERPLPPGHKRLMQDWEIVFWGSLIAVFLLILITTWAKPETSLNVWAEEELRERKLLAGREAELQIQ